MVEGGDCWYCARASGHEFLVRAVPRYTQEFGVANVGFLAAGLLSGSVKLNRAKSCVGSNCCLLRDGIDLAIRLLPRSLAKSANE